MSAANPGEAATVPRPQLVIRFPVSTVQRYRDGPGQQLTAPLRARFGAFAARVPGATLRRVFLRPHVIDSLVARAKVRTPGYVPPDFRSWLALAVPPAADSGIDGYAAEMREWHPEIRTDVIRLAPVGPSWPRPNREPFLVAFSGPGVSWEAQRHLAPSSGTISFDADGRVTELASTSRKPGVDAMYGWRFPGGDGAGVSLCDVEGRWYTDHTDFPLHSYAGSEPPPPDDLLDATARAEHGTMAIVTACGRANGSGAIGCAPGLDRIHLSTIFGPVDDTETNLCNAITEGAACLDAGDVLLLEVQNVHRQPVEVSPDGGVSTAVQAALTLVTAGLVLVVEAAGTADPSPPAPPERDLDAVGFPDDPGAQTIIVSAASPRTRRWSVVSTFGTRVDCHAWGAEVRTSRGMATGGSGPVPFSFTGSSAAAAIVAGLVLQIQGMLAAHGRGRKTPLEMRRLLRTIHDDLHLSELGIGEPSEDSTDYPIGPLPDLQRIVDGYLGLPDVYVRHFAGDSGSRNLFGALGQSPDVFFRTDPTAGGASGLTARVSNRGAASSSRTAVWLFKAPASPVSPGTAWTRIAEHSDLAVPAGGSVEAVPVTAFGLASAVTWIATLGTEGVVPFNAADLPTVADVIWAARVIGKVAWKSGVEFRLAEPKWIPSTEEFSRMPPGCEKGEIALWIPGASPIGGVPPRTSLRVTGPFLRSARVGIVIDEANAEQLKVRVGPALPRVAVGSCAGYFLELTEKRGVATHKLLMAIPSTSEDRRADVTIVVTPKKTLNVKAVNTTLVLEQWLGNQVIGSVTFSAVVAPKAKQARRKHAKAVAPSPSAARAKRKPVRAEAPKPKPRKRRKPR